MVKEAIDLMDNGAITFSEDDEEYDTMVSAMSKQVDTMIIHGNFKHFYSLRFNSSLNSYNKFTLWYIVTGDA